MLNENQCVSLQGKKKGISTIVSIISQCDVIFISHRVNYRHVSPLWGVILFNLPNTSYEFR